MGKISIKYSLDGDGAPDNLDKGALELLGEVHDTLNKIQGVISTTETVYKAVRDKDVLHIFNLIRILQGQIKTLQECLTDPSRR